MRYGAIFLLSCTKNEADWILSETMNLKILKNFENEIWPIVFFSFFVCVYVYGYACMHVCVYRCTYVYGCIYMQMFV